MANKKIEKTESDYTRNELEFLSMMKFKEPVIAIISEHDERRDEAVDWLRQKLRNECSVAGVSTESHDNELFDKLDPDILIGDSIKDLSVLLSKGPHAFIGNGSYIYFSRTAKANDIKEWLGIDNNGQHLVDVWLRLNRN